MKNKFDKNYLYVYADVFFVKGHTRTMVCDIKKNMWFFVPNEYYEIYESTKEHTIAEILSQYDEEAVGEVSAFFDFLLDEDYAALVHDIKLFPDFTMKWDSPFKIENCIIDIDINSDHDYKKIADELQKLGCQEIQIRQYKETSKNELAALISHFMNRDFKVIQLILKYNKNISLEWYENINIKDSAVSFIINNCPANKDFSLLSSKAVKFVKQNISSCQDCGIINTSSFFISDLPVNFIEGIVKNKCLNRKISVDINGNIKNCPSMHKSYGNINNTSFSEVLDIKEFTALFDIKKDEIEGCKDCEYRYVCSDCRAYVKDQYAKPVKCGYDPYSGKWKN